MGKFTCPYCYGQHDVNTCLMTCSKTSCPNGVSKDAMGHIDMHSYAKCKKCSALKDYLCPDSENVIPLRCIDSTSLTVALVGATGSGKSVYIAVLVNEIKKRMARGFGTNMNMNATFATKETYSTSYFENIYDAHIVVDATDKDKKIPPMIFPIDFPDKKKLTLTIYDNAGEKFANDGGGAEKRGEIKYIQNANGIIALIDPYQIPSIRKRLSVIPGFVLPPENKGTTAFDVLDYIINLLEEKAHGKLNKKFDADLAVVFTKIDALDGFDDIMPDGCSLKSDSEYVQRGAFIQSEFENTQAEMTALLENVLEEDEDKELKGKLERFKNYALFGVSALGVVPLSSRIPEDEFRPRRVLDPLLWILKTNKYIKTVK